MKKTVNSLLLFVFAFVIGNILALSTFAATTTTTTATATTSTNWDSAASLKRVNTIGNKLLTANKLPSGITFKVSDEDTVNAYANINKEIYVYKGLLQYVQNDEELAAVIAHEMGHIINSHCVKQTLFNSLVENLTPDTTTEKGQATAELAQLVATTKLSRAEEYDADLTGIDLMVTAGYNPLAMISVLNKICGNYLDVLETHPSGEKRLMNIYDYVNYNYPAKVKTGFKSDSYTKALVVINANITERNKSAKKVAKVQKDQEKLKAKREKRAKSMQKNYDPWTTSYVILKTLSEQSQTSTENQNTAK